MNKYIVIIKLQNKMIIISNYYNHNAITIRSTVNKCSVFVKDIIIIGIYETQKKNIVEFLATLHIKL